MYYGRQNKAEPLKNAIDRIITGFGWEELVIQEKIPEIWKETVGEKIASKAKSVRFEKGVLYIRVTASTWKVELMLRREKIRDEINKKYGSKIVDNIVIR